jgi:hypothetical protein
MTRPGTQIISRDQAPPRSTPPTQTDAWFAVGATATGPLEPVLVRSLASYEATFGARSGGTLLYDSIDAYFREGGARAYISAIPTTVTQLSVQTLSAGELQALTRDQLNAQAAEAGVDNPEALANKQAVVDAIVQTAGEPPHVELQTVPSPAQFKTALDLFTADLGPGQVSVPGISDSVTQGNLLAHAEANNRVALLDCDQGAPTAAALTAIATALHSVDGCRYGALLAPWAVVPGIAGGTSREVPYSAIEAGIIAKNDGKGLDPNVPAAGIVNGLATFAIDLDAGYTDLEYEQLNDAGVDLARLIYGGVATYGYRTVVDSAVDSLWEDFGNSRLNMAIVAQANAIAERYVFAQLDGRGRKIAQFGSELSAMLAGFYDADALYGATAAEAFQVDVGSSVNTPATIANGELHAILSVRMSPFAELVVIEIVRVALTEAIAA